MYFIALKMLIGDRAKYIGIIIGLTFASLLITQQSAIFLGIMTRTYSFLTDVGLPDIWVVDPQVQYIGDIKPLRDTEVLRVRGMEGIEWAVPLYQGSLDARLSDGTFQSCIFIGLDDETLIGGPPKMLAGKLSDLRQSDAVIVDVVGAEGKLAKVLPDGRRVPLQIGDEMELNDNRAVVVGICEVTRTFQANPVIYTTYSRATTFSPQARKMFGYGLGVGVASVWGTLLSGRTQIAFRLPWQLLVISAAAVVFICLTSAAFSIRKVMNLEPAVVFRS